MERLMVKPPRLLLLPCCLYHVSQQIARFCTTYWTFKDTKSCRLMGSKKRGGPKQIWQTALQAHLFIYVYCSADTLVCFGVFCKFTCFT